jgi:hypothetical protein
MYAGYMQKTYLIIPIYNSKISKIPKKKKERKKEKVKKLGCGWKQASTQIMIPEIKI